jgi:enoyl-CoA hydratase
VATEKSGQSANTAVSLVITERHENVGLLRLNHPATLNALSDELTNELTVALDQLESDDHIGAIILTGGDKAFAAGANIKEMRHRSFEEMYLSDFVTRSWERITRCRKPVIAAVAGYALGGGCELALMCDFIIAAETARFGQPEVTIGILPGAGATQRLPRLIGKSRAMDMILTGRMIDAEEAERMGMVSRVVPSEKLIEEAIATGQHIASLSRTAVLMAKECVNRSFEMSLAEGIRFERRMFHAAFSTEGQKEGMAAFVEKRPPDFQKL